jgi:hypothetical protein
VSLADQVSDTLKSECFEKPVPKTLNWRVMDVAKMLGVNLVMTISGA